MRNIFRALAGAFALCLAALAPAHAVITSTSTKVVASCNGATTAFNFSFVGVSSADLTVTLTSSSGTSTTLAATTYSVTFNPIASNMIWAVGGSVTYPLVGSPCPAGSTLTIARSVPLIQPTPFANQGVLLPNAIETSVDLLTLEVQQLNTLFSGAIVQPLTDTQSLSTLPAAALRANLALCFDATGYILTACSVPASGTISSAMQPVVSAGSLAAGRTALGLGGAATENIGSYGIADDGSGNLRQSYPVVSDATNQAVTAAFHQTQRICTGPITYTLPRANTLQSGFQVTIVAIGSICTVLPNASDGFPGVPSGTAVAISAGSVCRLSTDAASSGTWRLDCNGQNVSLAANASSNALTITLTAPALQFRNPSLPSGQSFWAVPAGGLSITIPSGATLGTSNSVPFRVWVFAAYNSGTPILGVATCSSTGQTYPCAAWESFAKNGTGISAGATSAGTLYGTSTITSDAVRLIGYVEYASGLATAGTWASNPTTVQVCYAPYRCPLPGATLQSIYLSAGAGGSQAVNMSSPANLVRFAGTFGCQVPAAAAVVVNYKRGSTTLLSQLIGGTGSANPLLFAAATILDNPASGAATYQFATTGSSCTGTISETFELDEIMGALDPPANDNVVTMSKAG